MTIKEMEKLWKDYQKTKDLNQLDKIIDEIVNLMF